MDEQWFYAREGQREGPVERGAVLGLLAGGSLDREALVWREGMPTWAPASKVPELAVVAGRPVPPPLPGNAPPPPPVLTVERLKVEPATWHRRVNGQRGPALSFDALGSLARAGVVGRDDPVARTGSEEWLPASRVPGLVLAASTPVSSATPPAVPAPAPPIRPLPSDVRGMNKWLYLAGLLLPLVLTGALLTINVQDEESRQVVLSVIAAQLAAATGVLLAFVHRMWSAIQDDRTRTRPGAAAGFLLLPLFNAYWIFRVFPGYVAEFNDFAARHGVRTRRMKLWLHLSLPVILLLLSGVAIRPENLPAASFLWLFVAGLAALAGVVAVTCDAVDELAEGQPVVGQPTTPPPVPS